MSKHTPGPWHLDPSVKGGYNVRDAFNNIPAIARTFDVGEAEANARLIAAAPDLAEALRSLRVDVEAMLTDEAGPSGDTKLFGPFSVSVEESNAWRDRTCPGVYVEWPNLEYLLGQLDAALAKVDGEEGS